MTSPQRRWEGVQKIAIWGDFQGLTGVTRRGGSKNQENGLMSIIYDLLNHVYANGT